MPAAMSGTVKAGETPCVETQHGLQAALAEMNFRLIV